MPRIGIDLSATRGHLIEVRAPVGRVSRRSSSLGLQDTRVLRFHTIPHGWSEPAALASALREWLASGKRNRGAWVTVWGLSSAHQLMLLPAAEPADLERLARHEAVRDVALLQQTEVISGSMPGGSRAVPGGLAKREVAFVAASAPDIRAKVQPLIDAGFVIEGVTTPALALCSIARLRRGITPGMPVALLAIGSGAIALAIVRDGVLMFAREIPWGYQGPASRPLDREEFAAKLAADLRRSFLFFKQTTRSEVAQVVLCGDAPDLRYLTAPLIVELDLEIETLDSLDGLAAAALPDPSDLFRDQVARFRLAWAMAADGAPPVNLVPPEIVIRRRARRHAVAMGRGVAAAMILGVLWYGYVDRTARADELRSREIEQQIVTLEPRVRRMEQLRQDGALASVRRTALDAFDTQGPRLARVLEALARAAPRDVSLRGLKLTASGASWTASVSGIAVSENPARAQAAVNDFLRAVQTSPYLGEPLASPSMRMSSGAQASPTSPEPDAPTSGAVSIPPGMSGIEFSVTFEIRK